MGMGLLSFGINEVIAVTKDNAAPIGIILREGQCPKMILFKGSKTEENIRKYGWVTANFVSRASLYARYAFEDVNAEELTSAGDMQRLSDADAWIGFTAAVTHEAGQTYMVDLTPVCEEVLSPGVRRVNRGFDAVIDASVHATRYVFNHSDELRQRILYDFELIRKCGGEDEISAMKILGEHTGISL